MENTDVAVAAAAVVVFSCVQLLIAKQERKRRLEEHLIKKIIYFGQYLIPLVMSIMFLFGAEHERVRVTFFQQSKPQGLYLPDETLTYNEDFVMAATSVAIDANHIPYNPAESTENGWDNPFRPGGDLSREADEIVELIKVGKPITPTPGTTAPTIPHDGIESVNKPVKNVPEPISQSSKKIPVFAENRENGNVQNDKKVGSASLDVQRGTIKPDGDAGQVEHITIKKKTKCKCCVLQ